MVVVVNLYFNTGNSSGCMDLSQYKRDMLIFTGQGWSAVPAVFGSSQFDILMFVFCIQIKLI